MKIVKNINLLIVVVLLSIFLPLIFDSAFNNGKNGVRVYYSEILDEFLVQGYNEAKKEPFFYVGHDKNISLDDFMQNLPFKFYSYLLSKNIFPEQFKEWADSDKIRENSQNLSIKPDVFNQKQIPVFTIFESKPKYLRLKFNKFGIRNNSDGLEFVNLENLSIDQNLSAIFTKSLKDANFKFPFIKFYTNANTKKPFDEGVFIIDGKDEIYHLKMEYNTPQVKQTGIKNSSVSLIIVNENPRREFYAALLDGEGVKLISYDNYKLVDLPSQGYNPKNMNFQLVIEPLSRVVTIESDDNVTAYKLDDKYNVLDKFEYKLKKNESFLKAKEIIFPFIIKKDYGYSYKFTFSDFSKSALFLNFALFVVFMLFCFRRSRSVFRVFLILLTGIYGFIAALVA